jgi:hypothetical protein
MARRNDAGKIVPIYKGPFSLETTYEILDVVTLNGGSYISLIDNNIGNNLTNGNC